MKFIARVPPGRLTRLDAEYYEPAALAVDSLVRSRQYKLLGDCIQEGYRVVYHGVDEVADGASIPFLAPSDIDENGDYDVDQIATNVPVQYLARYPKGLTKANEILIEVKGNTAKVALVQEMDAKTFMVSGSLYKAQVKADTDPRFMASYLSCTHGSRLKRRVISNVNISYIGKDDLYDLPTPAPSIDTQHYIGSKVRQAEGLREWARNSIRRILADYESVELRVAREAGLHTRVSGKDLRDRLDAEHYPDDVLQLFRAIEPSRAANIQSLTDEIFSGTTLSVSEGQTSTLQATVATLGSLFLNDRLRNVVAPRNKSKRLKTHDLAIAAAAHTASYIGRDVTYCVADDQIYPSTEVLVIRPVTGGVPSTWLWCFLKSQLGYRQIQACVRGITAHAYSDDICHVRVPLPEAEVADRFHSYDDKMVLASNATKLAKALTDSARFLVEALIEGMVTEADLIAAGKDADANRALLARLRDDGLDGVGTRLFPDIDALFDLIEQVQGKEADS